MAKVHVSNEAEMTDLENVLYFYSARELDFIVQSAWNYVEISPYHLDSFRYRIEENSKDQCVVVYKDVDNNNSWESVERELIKSATRKRSKMQIFNQDQLLTIDQLSEKQMKKIRWDYITWDNVVESLKNPNIFSSVTLDSLILFFRYAKNTLRDPLGSEQILNIIAKGRKDKIKYQSKTFDTREFNALLPSWEIEDIDILSALADNR